MVDEMIGWLEEPTNISVPFWMTWEIPQHTVPGALAPNNTERDPNPRCLRIISDTNKENLPPAAPVDEDEAVFANEMELVSEDDDDDIDDEDDESVIFGGGVDDPSNYPGTAISPLSELVY